MPSCRGVENGSSRAPPPTGFREVFAIPFRFRAEFTERSIFRAVGGIRCGNFAVGKDERVKFKFFAIPIKFYFGCSRGGETISNAEVFSPASSTSLAGAALNKLKQYSIYLSKNGTVKISASASSHKVQCEHHLVAVLFVCGKSVIARTAAEV